jgi:hypothetical protein
VSIGRGVSRGASISDAPAEPVGDAATNCGIATRSGASGRSASDRSRRGAGGGAAVSGEAGHVACGRSLDREMLGRDARDHVVGGEQRVAPFDEIIGLGPQGWRRRRRRGRRLTRPRQRKHVARQDERAAQRRIDTFFRRNGCIAFGQPFGHGEDPQDRCRGIGRYRTVFGEDDVGHDRVVQPFLVAAEVVVRDQLVWFLVEVLLHKLRQRVERRLVHLRGGRGKLQRGIAELGLARGMNGAGCVRVSQRHAADGVEPRGLRPAQLLVIVGIRRDGN